MNDTARYVKIGEWSEGNQFHVGSTPGLVYGAHRAVNERQVFVDLCQAGTSIPQGNRILIGEDGQQVFIVPTSQFTPGFDGGF